eukprot:TRINITY_DN137_c0_g1_i1.p3 TRINITY_DN137_c0_g1~~TRINITY_DN137_c0_g1_i1.p3  ORF type:complete len:238 (-),score=-34.25 TRINITY_DN137_c0_g1_i1:1323-2036(-)
MDFFKDFYDFLKELYNSNTYYTYTPNTIKGHFEQLLNEGNYITFKTDDDFLVWLKYNLEEKAQRLDRQVGGLSPTRETLSLNKLADELDKKKTFRALQANLTHTIDAYLLRKIVLNLGSPLITIHDCVGVDILKIKNFENIAIISTQYIYDLNILGLKDRVPLTVRSRVIFIQHTHTIDGGNFFQQLFSNLGWQRPPLFQHTNRRFNLFKNFFDFYKFRGLRHAMAFFFTQKKHWSG